jgi:hypothetical protein
MKEILKLGLFRSVTPEHPERTGLRNTVYILIEAKTVSKNHPVAKI